MAERYFKNPYPDYSEGEEVVIDRGKVEELIKKYVGKIERHTQPDGRSRRGDLYVGDAGIAFMFWKLENSKILLGCKLAGVYVNSARANISRRDEKKCALLSGDAGIWAVSAAVSGMLDDQKQQERDVKQFLEGYKICSKINYAPEGGDEFLVGRAGYLSGAFFINRISPHLIEPQIIENIGSILLESGRNYSSANNSGIPLIYQYHGKEYLGAAHGLCAILWALLHIPKFANQNDVKSSIDAYMNLQDSSGNFPTKWSNRENKLVHWCHGSPGAFYLFAKAFKVYGEAKYLDACRRCCDSIWERGLLLKGPGICHGIAGNGYAFLVMFKLTCEKKYLYQAGKFMEFLMESKFKKYASKPDRPYSLYEGLAGTVCFLVDLLNPHEASFPFMEV